MSMMRTMTLAMLGAALLFTLGCASRRPSAKTPVVDVHEMDQAMLRGAQKDTILKVPAGARIPIHLSARTPFCHTECGAAPAELVFDRTTFVYLPLDGSGEPLLSYDRRSWQEFSDAMDGSLKFALQREHGGTPTANITLNVHDPSARPTQVARAR